MPKKGEHISEETREKMRNARLGKKHAEATREKLSSTRKRLFAEGKLQIWNKGKRNIYTLETRQKISNGAKGSWQKFTDKDRTRLSRIRRSTLKKMWGGKDFYDKMRLVLAENNRKIVTDPIIREKQKRVHKELWRNLDYISHVKNGLKIKPNEDERYLDAVLQLNFRNQWRYTGDFGFWIEGKNPDFVNINSKKLLIEFNGHPFNHTAERDKAKTDHYAKYGWKALNLCYNDMKDERLLISKIATFMDDSLNKRVIG